MLFSQPFSFLFSIFSENSREIQSFASYWAEKYQTGKLMCVSVFNRTYIAKKRSVFEPH